MDVLQSFSLAGKTALLTGGAGLYGRQICAALAEAGARTFIAARNLDALEQVAAEERARGFDVTALPLDLDDQASIDALHDRTGPCDILVNNAVARNPRALWGGPMAEYDTSLRVNASALFYITELYSRGMIAARAGSIVNIGSMQGTVGVEQANYAGTNMWDNPTPVYFYEKGGMQNFTRWAASVLGPHNVRVNTISPGGFFTGQPDPFPALYSARTQLGRMANDTDLKGAVVFLASDASAYITGANLAIDGGYTAK